MWWVLIFKTFSQEKDISCRRCFLYDDAHKLTTGLETQKVTAKRVIHTENPNKETNKLKEENYKAVVFAFSRRFPFLLVLSEHISFSLGFSLEKGCTEDQSRHSCALASDLDPHSQASSREICEAV